MGPLQNSIAITILLISALPCIAQRPPAAGTDSAAAIKQADLQFCRDVQQRGLDGWMSYFTADAIIGPGDTPIRGKEAIRTIYSRVFARQNLDFQWVPTAGEIFGSGNLGYTTGRAHMSYIDNGKAKERTSRYVTIWAKQSDSTWKVIADFGAPDPTPQDTTVRCK